MTNFTANCLVSVVMGHLKNSVVVEISRKNMNDLQKREYSKTTAHLKNRLVIKISRETLLNMRNFQTSTKQNIGKILWLSEFVEKPQHWKRSRTLEKFGGTWNLRKIINNLEILQYAKKTTEL